MSSNLILGFATCALLSISASAHAISCDSLYTRMAWRMLLKDRKAPLAFGSSSLFVLPLAPRGRIGRAVHGAQSLVWREAARTDASVSLVDGPIASWSEKRFGKQKQLTIPAQMLLYSLPVSIAVNQAMHALFPQTLLDPEEQHKLKTKIENRAGIEWNHAELEQLLREHPEYLDIHREFLAASKKNPNTNIVPYLQQVVERMNQLKEKVAGLAGYLAHTQPTLTDYEKIATLIGKEDLSEKDLEKLTPEQQQIWQRRELFEEALTAEEFAADPSLRPLVDSFGKMMQTLQPLMEGKPNPHLNSAFHWSPDFVRSAEGLALMDRAISKVVAQFSNSYWQNDVLVDPHKRMYWEKVDPAYQKALNKFFSSEAASVSIVQRLKEQSRHRLYLQTAIKQLSDSKLDIEWQNALGISWNDGGPQTAEGVLLNLEEQMQSLKQLKSSSP